MKPNQYIVRTFGENIGNQEHRLWAFSASDAKLQIETMTKWSSKPMYVCYVGPVNPDCKCLNECRCGVSAQ